LSYAPTVGIWLVGRTEIIASDRLFSQSDALIHLEDRFSTILPYTHDSTDFLGGINDSPTNESALTSRNARSVSRLLSCAALH